MGYHAKVRRARRFLLKQGGGPNNTPPQHDLAITARVVAKLWPRKKRGKTSHRPPHVAPRERSPFVEDEA